MYPRTTDNKTAGSAAEPLKIRTEPALFLSYFISPGHYHGIRRPDRLTVGNTAIRCLPSAADYRELEFAAGVGLPESSPESPPSFSVEKRSDFPVVDQSTVLMLSPQRLFASSSM